MTSSYPRGSLGHVLHHLRKLGVSEHIAGTVIFDGDGDKGSLNYCGKLFAEFRYFDGIEKPLFRFQDNAFLRQTFVIASDGMFLRPEFHLSLGPHDNPALEIYGTAVTPDLHQYISGVVGCQFVNEPEYQIKKDAGAFFQGGSAGPEEQRIYVEFWNPAGAQAFVDYVNQNYRQEIQPGDIAPMDDY